jgi:hypothetical protein
MSENTQIDPNEQRDPLGQPVEQPVEAVTNEPVASEQQPESLDTENLVDPNDSRNVAKRIGKLTKKLSEKEQELEYWRQQAMNRSGEPVVGEQTAVAAEVAGRPRADDFSNQEDFIEALTEWKLTEKETRVAHERATRAVQDTYYSRVNEFSQTAPDFSVAVGEIQDQLGSDPNVVDFILDSEVGPAIAYHLANNESVFKNIMAMSSVRRVAALGKIEAQLEAKRSAAANRSENSQPAARVTSNTGSAVSTNTAKPEGGSYTEWKKWREANRRK